MEEKNPTLFISYSHDSKEHQDRVLNLSNKLRGEGIDCILDQYEDSPPEGWPKWMDKNIKKSDFVLVVCTEVYYNRVMGDDEKGLGIKWESTLIYQQLYNAGANNTKLIPVIFNDGKFEYIPEPLQGSTFYNVDDSESYDKLYWRLRGVKREKPKLGKLRELPLKERKTLFVSGLIDQVKWDEAKWKNGVAYLFADKIPTPPVITVFFDNFELGKEIFKEIIEKVGKDDVEERLRLSIIEGDAPNQEHGYFVTIGENIEATDALLKKTKVHQEIKYVAIGQRIHRMKPDKDSKNLSYFKSECQKYGCYFIAPAKQTGNPEKGEKVNVDVDLDHKIFKRKIEFRKYEDVSTDNDPDSILKSGYITNHKF
ncbi:toll/interleukin-1 receptor domain-containing protein [Runella sp. MFBS21]|uniref:toll/interleukin-1 receptor domain-containing protein n=1 Tax=Runella sp. MFBS21 TaxID=3034018 RepID=UPI0023F68CDC|nr:toll/interleukin-1 receptor domain-containing protein [Runella sp. MFBS21]MDF7819855.1 toll/interleukin-1 receptor domain-containing protein [Runella sp. MFBS21]